MLYHAQRREGQNLADSRQAAFWDLFESTPEPVGYDPALLWPAGPSDPTFGVLELTPWRVEICSLQELMSSANRIWKV